MGILAHFLAARPDVQQQLRDQPSLLPAAIEEIQRLHGPLVANRRVTTCPTQIGGREIAAGERLSLIWIAANRDGRVFERADEFLVDRDQTNNLLYGAGVHVCPGAPLARLEMRVAMEELLAATSQLTLLPERPPSKARYPASGYATLPLVIR